MIKDKIKIPSFSLKLSYTILIVGITLLGLFQLWQWSSTGDLRKESKKLKIENIELHKTNSEITLKIKSDSILIVKKQSKIDSLLIQDQKHLTQLYKISKRYEKLKVDYDIATDDVKNDIFTRLINN